jgi:CBS domain-containing protein
MATLAPRQDCNMSVSFLLTPKSEVVWVPAGDTLAQALERMQPSGYAAVPVLGTDGRYLGTLTEGDILWYLLDAGEPGQIVDTSVLAVPRRTNNQPVHIDAKIETLFARAADQNFVPVLDDREVFIGIVRRKSILEHFAATAGG